MRIQLAQGQAQLQDGEQTGMSMLEKTQDSAIREQKLVEAKAKYIKDFHKVYPSDETKVQRLKRRKKLRFHQEKDGVKITPHRSVSWAICNVAACDWNNCADMFKDNGKLAQAGIKIEENREIETAKNRRYDYRPTESRDVHRRARVLTVRSRITGFCA